MLLAVEVTHAAAYYASGVAAVAGLDAGKFRRFLRIACLGLIGQVGLAVVQPFNVLVFLLRVACIAYAQFLRNFLIALMLLRNQNGLVNLLGVTPQATVRQSPTLLALLALLAPPTGTAGAAGAAVRPGGSGAVLGVV